MKLYFKQKMFSFTGDSNIYDESGQVAFVVKGQISWGKEFIVYDRYGNSVGIVKRNLKSFMPQFDIFLGTDYVGSIRKKFSFPTSRYAIDYNGWTVDGSTFGYNYIFRDRNGYYVASAAKEEMTLSDRYVLDIADEGNPDPLTVLMFIIAIDCEKASRS